MPAFAMNDPSDYYRLLDWLREPRKWNPAAWEFYFREGMNPHDGVPQADKIPGRWTQVTPYQPSEVTHNGALVTGEFAVWDWEWRLRRRISPHTLHILRSACVRFRRSLGEELSGILVQCPVPMWGWSVERTENAYSPRSAWGVLVVHGRGNVNKEHLPLVRWLTRQLCNQIKSVFAFRSGFKTEFTY